MSQTPVWTPITPKTGALFHADSHTDVEMSGTVDGLKLVRAVRDRWPPVTIMATSGRTKVGKDDMPENGLFFAKPYPRDDIIKALNGISAQIQA